MQSAPSTVFPAVCGRRWLRVNRLVTLRQKRESRADELPKRSNVRRCPLDPVAGALAQSWASVHRTRGRSEPCDTVVKHQIFGKPMSSTVRVPTTAGADARHVNAAVSRRLKELRKQQELTLDEMSRRSGVSKGMLVEIEKGDANPSIAILCKAAAVFGVSVADIVNVSEVSPFHIVHPEEMSSLWNGPAGGSAVLLAGANGPETIELWKWNMKAGEHYVSHGHPNRTTELLYVETGELTLTLGEEVIHIPRGCSIVAQTDRYHSYANTGTTELSFSMTVASLRP